MTSSIITAEFVMIGLAFVAFAVPLALGKVRPNRFVGIRVAATRKSPAVWYAANRIGAYCFGAVGVATAAAALVLDFSDADPIREALTCAKVLGLGTVVAAVISIVCANRLAKAEDRP